MSSEAWLNDNAQKVLDLLSGERIFGFDRLPPFPVAVECDFENACKLAWTPYEWSAITVNKDREIHARLFERENHPVFYEKVMSVFREVEEAFSKRFRFCRNLGPGPKFRRNMYWECVDDICGNLGDCYLSRILQMNDDFWERVFLIYEAGCWPCGWRGDYPNGTFIVYKATT